MSSRVWDILFWVVIGAIVAAGAFAMCRSRAIEPPAEIVDCNIVIEKSYDAR